MRHPRRNPAIFAPQGTPSIRFRRPANRSRITASEVRPSPPPKKLVHIGHSEPIPSWNALFGQRSTTSSTYLSGDGAYSVKYSPSAGGTKSLFVVDDPSYGLWNPTTYLPTGQAGSNNGYGIFTGTATLTPTLSSMVMDSTTSHAIAPVAGTRPNNFYWVQGGYFDGATSSIYLAALRNEAGTLNPKGFNVVKLPVDSIGAPNYAAANTLANQYDTGFFFFFNAADTTQTVGFPMQMTKLADGFVYVYGWKGAVRTSVSSSDDSCPPT